MNDSIFIIKPIIILCWNTAFNRFDFINMIQNVFSELFEIETVNIRYKSEKGPIPFLRLFEKNFEMES